MAAPNPALAQMMARQLIEKLAKGGADATLGAQPGGAAAGPGGPSMIPGVGGPSGPGGPPIPPGGPAGLVGPGGPSSPGAPPVIPAGLQLSQQLSELQNADPDAMVKSLSASKSMVVSLYTRAAFTMPGVSRNLAQVVKYLDNAIQEAEKAAAATAAAGPIANNAGIPSPAGQTGNAPVAGLGS